MPQRKIQTACQRCRKKRAKCDGQSPCLRCEEASEPCEYIRDRWESKNELRAKIERLKKSNDGRADLLESIAVTANQSFNTIQPGSDSSMAYDRAQDDFSTPTDDDLTSRFGSSSKGVSPRELPGLSCFEQLHSWRLCHPSTSKSKASASDQSTILSLPPLPLDAYASDSQTDTWTRTGWTRAHIRHLFDSVLTWDYLPFSLLDKDQFLRDYQTGSSQFCSSALVHSVLALASRLINENDDDFTLLPSGWFGSKLFLDEAETLLQANEPLENLPDIQALGMLSFYHVRCGREARAHELAEACIDRITRVRQQEKPKGEEEQSYARACAITYCGAVSLVRILQLTTGLLFNAPTYAIQDNTLILEDPFTNNIDNGQAGASTPSKYCRPLLGSVNQSSDQRTVLFADSQKPQHYDLSIITAKVFQLTELAYNLVASARVAPETAMKEVVATYGQCLDWYEAFFTLVSREGSRTPFILFVHMYYHFCVLCAFRPFVSLAWDSSDIQPHKICAQAAQSILALAQSYDDLFTLRRVSGLIPYLICASGMYGLGMSESGSPMDLVHLRLGDYTLPPIKAEFKSPGFDSKKASAPAPPSHIKMSVAAHARLLLAKIGSTHPAAIVAERMLATDLRPSV
ncbi:nitrate assimilation regulatory protein nirA [Dactylonectria estremocensis]|uniref:Nitrate assimilation regulatory protein nirA n=1 Tax=Dactylonectria estremocensis TaxID=1079267 RepID=A0A9P9IZU5_9HYPO|nr:nitrate assimilation regulatory protein nirA [Dactylonectria estremocensis]